MVEVSSEEILQGTVVIDADPGQAYERGKTDFNFFAGVMAPHVMVTLFPDFYIGLFQLLTTRSPKQMKRILRFALGLPRGHAKTTFIKIIIAWLIVYDKISFAVIVCATQPLAENLLEDVNDMLSSENARLIYGDWNSQLSTDRNDLKKCFYHGRPVTLVARGGESSIRGINIKHARPDLIFCDDAQTKECDDSPAESEKFAARMVAMFKIIAPLGSRLIIYVGNMYSEGCFLAQLSRSASWVSLITGAIKADGTPLWPELHSLEELMESFYHDESLGRADVWFAEVMNDPISKSLSLLSGNLPEYPLALSGIVPDGVYLTIDPAGFRDNSDDNVIVVHYVYDGKGMVAELDAGIKDPEQLIVRALQLALEHGASLIAIEEVGYQQTLLFWVRKYLINERISGIHVVPLKPSGRSKEARIRLFVQELLAGNYYLLLAARALFVWQAMLYKIGKKKNKDDILDACAYGLDVRTHYWQLVWNNKASGKWLLPAKVVEDNTPF